MNIKSYDKSPIEPPRAVAKDADVAPPLNKTPISFAEPPLPPSLRSTASHANLKRPTALGDGRGMFVADLLRSDRLLKGVAPPRSPAVLTPTDPATAARAGFTGSHLNTAVDVDSPHDQPLSSARLVSSDDVSGYSDEPDIEAGDDEEVVDGVPVRPIDLRDRPSMGSTDGPLLHRQQQQPSQLSVSPDEDDDDISNEMFGMAGGVGSAITPHSAAMIAGRVR